MLFGTCAEGGRDWKSFSQVTIILCVCVSALALLCKTERGGDMTGMLSQDTPLLSLLCDTTVFGESND